MAVGGLAILVASLALVGVAVWFVRPRSSARAVVLTLALAGAGLGVGALMIQRDVGIASWILTPLIMAGLTIAHTLTLTAGTGPLRTG